MQFNINKLKTLPLQWQIVIAVAPSVILIALFIFLIYLPKNSEMKTLSDRLVSLDAEIESSTSKIKRLDTLIAENTRLKAKLEKLKEQLPEGKEVSVLLKQISELGMKSGLKILLWKPEPKLTDPQGLYVEIPVRVEVKAEYHKLGVFFSHISRLPRLVNISGLDLKTSIVETDMQGTISANFVARTFASMGPDNQPKQATTQVTGGH